MIVITKDLRILVQDIPLCLKYINPLTLELDI